MCFPSLWNTLGWQVDSQPKHSLLVGLCLPGVHQQVLSWSLRWLWLVVMGSIMGGRDESWEPIRTQQVDGPAQVFWQALLAGDHGTVAEILRDPQNNLSPNAVFDTSDLEEWKNYRFNPRGLSMGEQWGAACAGCCGAWLLLGLCVTGAAWVAEEWEREQEHGDVVRFSCVPCGSGFLFLRAEGASGKPGPSQRGFLKCLGTALCAACTVLLSPTVGCARLSQHELIFEMTQFERGFGKHGVPHTASVRRS